MNNDATKATERFVVTLTSEQIEWLAAEARHRGKGNGRRFTKSQLVRVLIDEAMNGTSEPAPESALLPDIETIEKRSDVEWARELKSKSDMSEAEQAAFAAETERRLNEALGL